MASQDSHFIHILLDNVFILHVYSTHVYVHYYTTCVHIHMMCNYKLQVYTLFHCRTLVNRSSPIFPTLSPFILRSVVLLITTSSLLVFRISLLHGQLPAFSDHDNPASFAPHTLTRILTYCYLFYFNTKLLVFPLVLCYDWQMGSIPLVERLSDVRNGWTLLFFVYFICLIMITSVYYRPHFVHVSTVDIVSVSIIIRSYNIFHCK